MKDDGTPTTSTTSTTVFSTSAPHAPPKKSDLRRYAEFSGTALVWGALLGGMWSWLYLFSGLSAGAAVLVHSHVSVLLFSYVYPPD